MEEHIKLYHGDGGKHTNALINELFYKYFNNEILLSGMDSAIFNTSIGRFAFTTDSFVVKPRFFPGGDIGKLAVCGTVNDLAVSGAKPLYLSTGFIIEEGFSINELQMIVESMGKTCQEIGVKVITGDTKVVEKGNVDGLYINTSGIGIVDKNYKSKPLQPGDNIIITGSIAEHGTVIALKRYDIKVKGDFKSDCGSVYNITSRLAPFYSNIKLMKDPTRGGLATALNEISSIMGHRIRILENNIPIRNEVRAVCSLLGIDPLYLASEGRAILVVDAGMTQEILLCIQNLDNGKDASIIGIIEELKDNIVYLETKIGGRRLLHTLDTPMLPRIC
ncbi:MAG: hydrogenase expression/formation protein HypE [Clostridiales bacterium]|nr:hydrogenase expression/formation protein HypE [Clostridiales bacterium]